MRLYQGAFLANEGEQEPWLVSTAERLRGKFLQNTDWLAQQWEAAELWENAAECYEQCLEIDDCVEEAYQRLMLCYQHLGKRGKALTVYSRCQRTLLALFGVDPSPKTQSIYKEILSNL